MDRQARTKKPQQTRKAKKPRQTKGPKGPKKTRRKKTRISKVATCIRRISATARIKKTGLPDNPKFSPASLTAQLSGKFTSLIQKIRELDAADIRDSGTMYKHFIFTDIREAAYGVKALAGFMIAAGFDLRMANEPKMIKRKGKMVKTKHGETKLVSKPAVRGGCNGFAILQSLPLWKNPLSVETKKTVLRTYNSRPDNINGELLRIVVLDSKFKEGIDLFDVKYVHLLEPAIATSDLKQAVGRATRYCGQRGLHFVPRRGWPLNVFVYHTMLPGRRPFLIGDASDQKVDAHQLMLAKSGLDLALLKLTQELTALAIRTAVDYDLNYKINNFAITDALMDETELDDVLVAEVENMAGGAREVKEIHRISDITPKVLAKCYGRKTALFPFTRARMVTAARRVGYEVPRRIKRRDLCDLMRKDRKLFKELYYPAPPSPPTPTPSTVGSERFPETLNTNSNNNNNNNSSNNNNNNNNNNNSARVNSAAERRAALAAELRGIADLDFPEFQTAISELYASHKWESPVVKSGCDAVAASRPGQPVTFTRTQDFVRHYLTAGSPFKGLLAWHSVGTGKTCMAVAAATTEFEDAGYTILWVTRNALMADVYKNMFGAVCSIPLIREVEDGLEIPADMRAAKRLLPRNFMAPISYRMFQNALQGKNELGRALLAKNKADPLHRTFLIMDEIHKLQDGDLGAAEAADFEVIQKFIHNSYAKSGDDSVRPLLMTATPITDTPKELFEILNTLIPAADDRLMKFDDFRDAYTNEAGEISSEGAKYFQGKAKGLISYLNREYDPTTFAQPVFTRVDVPIGGVMIPEMEELITRCMAGLEAPELEEEPDCGAAEAAAEEATLLVNESDMKPKEKVKALKAIEKTLKAQKKACEKQKKAFAKTRKAVIKGVLKEAQACYASEKKAVTAAGNSQIKELEKCFTSKGERKAPTEFPDKAAYLKAIEDRMFGAQIGSPNSAESLAGAVFNV